MGLQEDVAEEGVLGRGTAVGVFGRDKLDGVFGLVTALAAAEELEELAFESLLTVCEVLGQFSDDSTSGDCGRLLLLMAGLLLPDPGLLTLTLWDIESLTDLAFSLTEPQFN